MGNRTNKLKVCEIYYAKESKELHANARYIAIIGLVSASLSLIGSASILGFIIWKKLVKCEKIRPLFHLSLADFVLSLLWIISTVKYFAGTEFDHPEYTAVSCFVYQLLTEMIHLVTFFLTINYSVDVYFKMKDRTIQVHMITEGEELPPSNVRKWFKKSLYLMSWGFPIIIMMPIMANITVDKINPCQRCVILIDVPVLLCEKVSQAYGYIVLAVTLTFSITTIIMLYCLTLRLYWKAVPGFRTDRQRREFYNMQARVALYMLIFIICWVPGIVISYHKWIKHLNGSRGLLDLRKYFYLYVYQALCAPIQGLLNSIVYGWTRKNFRRSSNSPPPLSPRNGTFVIPYCDFASTASASEDDDNETNGLIKRVTDPPLGY